ncbi:sulfotransferase family protein [Aliiruegeria haliotis]|uniref:Sulfotransferase family protein n=1 Tax=Aliiruegeria haliotis TaxID=1280846 RepID=A0A2T0RK20_9RHOB|nr:sulfotransferase [Aliiruegeria haliotis]PRY21508.1 sulfotransferase family protein [Aliiruegeria haliotis]
MNRPALDYDELFKRFLDDGAVLPEGKEVIFCLGTQKAGTSWLWHYLKDHWACHVFYQKELHFFDALHINRNEQVHRISNRLNRAVEKLRQASPEEYNQALTNVRRLGHRLDMYRAGQEGRAAYLANMMVGSGKARYLCDLTPGYQLLSEDGLRDMASVGRSPRFLFIMRDPVARLWSQVRMNASDAGAEGAAMAQRSQDVIRRLLKEGGPELKRADYRGALERMDNVLPADRTLVLFYEDLFQQETADRLCGFLGIKSRPVDTRVFYEGSKANLPEDLRLACREMLKDQYDYVLDRFGERVPAKWRAGAPAAVTG